MLEFEVEATCGRARVARLSVSGRTVRTPALFPVATAGAAKPLTPQQLAQCGVGGLLVNAFHLHLRPGEELVHKAGGIHRFMAWDGLIISDSGGFQVFSLGSLVRVEEAGVRFRSPYDGRELFIGPQEATAIQERLGADIIMAFDECPPYPVGYDAAQKAVERTIKWARVCVDVHKTKQPLFAITQGSVFEDLRRRCIDALLELNTPGYAIGGLSVGEPREKTHAMCAHDASLLPQEKPRYLMGVGDEADILAAVKAGVDMFDCVLPTRNARNGQLLTREGRLRILASAFRNDLRPPDERCTCYTCRHFSRAYLRHLFASREMLGPVLAAIHNLSHLQTFMELIQEAIRRKTLGRIATPRQLWLDSC